MDSCAFCSLRHTATPPNWASSSWRQLVLMYCGPQTTPRVRQSRVCLWPPTRSSLHGLDWLLSQMGWSMARISLSESSLPNHSPWNSWDTQVGQIQWMDHLCCRKTCTTRWRHEPSTWRDPFNWTRRYIGWRGDHRRRACIPHAKSESYSVTNTGLCSSHWPTQKNRNHRHWHQHAPLRTNWTELAISSSQWSKSVCYSSSVVSTTVCDYRTRAGLPAWIPRRLVRTDSWRWCHDSLKSRGRCTERWVQQTATSKSDVGAEKMYERPADSFPSTGLVLSSPQRPLFCPLEPGRLANGGPGHP